MYDDILTMWHQCGDGPTLASSLTQCFIGVTVEYQEALGIYKLQTSERGTLMPEYATFVVQDNTVLFLQYGFMRPKFLKPQAIEQTIIDRRNMMPISERLVGRRYALTMQMTLSLRSNMSCLSKYVRHHGPIVLFDDDGNVMSDDMCREFRKHLDDSMVESLRLSLASFLTRVKDPIAINYELVLTADSTLYFLGAFITLVNSTIFVPHYQVGCNFRTPRVLIVTAPYQVYCDTSKTGYMYINERRELLRIESTEHIISTVHQVSMLETIFRRNRNLDLLDDYVAFRRIIGDLLQRMRRHCAKCPTYMIQCKKVDSDFLIEANSIVSDVMHNAINRANVRGLVLASSVRSVEDLLISNNSAIQELFIEHLRLSADSRSLSPLGVSLGGLTNDSRGSL